MKTEKDDCNGFEPQNYLRDRCKKCFRLKTKHLPDGNNNNYSNSNKNNTTAVATTTTNKTTTVRRPNTIVGLMSAGSTSHSPSTPSTSTSSSSTSTCMWSSASSSLSSSSPLSPTAIVTAMPLNVSVSASRISTLTTNNNNSANETNQLNNSGKTRTPKNSLTSASGEIAALSTSLIVKSSSTQNNNNNNKNADNRPKSMIASASSENITSHNNTSDSTKLSTSSSFGKKERRRSWRDKSTTVANQNGDDGPDCEDTADSISLASYKTANSKGISSTKSMESVNSTMDSRSMVTAMSGGSTDFNDERAITPTSNATSNLPDRDMVALRKENTRLQDQVAKFKKERQRWTRLRRHSKSSADACATENPDTMAEERLADAESLLQEYREENSMLKSELRDLQENISSLEKLNHAEKCCKELTQKNTELQQNVDELQREIEEMQDQYREEEIDEFRELQRDLEQNAKNCRILQFKLRKSERQREQLQAEKNVFAAKLREFQQQTINQQQQQNSKMVYGQSNAASTTLPIGPRESARVRELESELRIAKEVSVRLHNELETAEDKRYKLEDEIFYYKEKLREMQTQNKWRETRNKAESHKAIKQRDETNTEELEAENTEAVLVMCGDDAAAAKQLRDVLERETDLREQLKFSEEDLHRTQNRLKEAENENEELIQKLLGLSEGKSILAKVNSANVASKKQQSVLTRSFSEDSQRTDVGDLYGRLRPPRTDGKPYKSFAAAEKKSGQQSSSEANRESTFESSEMGKDIARLLKTIQELEQKNSELRVLLQKSESKLLQLQGQQASIADNRGLSVELRKEQELRKELSAELMDYKQLIAKSDNNKLIAMATKVELLSNQLKALNDRFETLHKKAVKDANDKKYTDNLKTRCDSLERELSELKAKQTFQVNNNSKDAAENNKAPTADEIEQCCALLASVDAQANRICKQLEKMDVMQKEERRRSLSKDTYAIVAADLENVMAELKVLHKLLETHKMYSKKEADEISHISESAKTSQTNEATADNACKGCAEKTTSIDAQKDEISFYKKKNKELTNQILQTEDRWTAEIEKQNSEHNAKIDKLKGEIKNLRISLREQTQLAETQAQTLHEKDKIIGEMDAKLLRIQTEMSEKQRIVQNLEKEQKALKEWEIRYKKLESIYEKEKQKFDAEKTRIKAETNALKKRTDDALAELTRLRDGHQRREILWAEERTRLEQEIAQLKNNLAQTCKAQFSNNIDEHNSGATRTVPIRTINYRTAAVAAAAKSDAKKDEQTERLREKCLILEKTNEEIQYQLQKTRVDNAQLEVQLSQSKEVWQKEKDTANHKNRRDEKIRSVEIEALQQKFTSRMNIMETSNKSLHSQLVQTRRERDTMRENIANYEQKLKEQLKALESERKKCATHFAKFNDSEKALNEALSTVQRMTSELSLAKETHRADKKLWAIEKQRIENTTNSTQASGEEGRIAENALKAAEDVQKQYAEYQKFYNKEVNRLKAKIRELNNELNTKENEFQRKAKELTEQIKILDIDQRNLVQVKEMQASAREAMQAEHARLTQLIQQAEVRRISRRYKIASVVEQLNSLLEKSQRNVRSQQEGSVLLLINVVNQLNALKENDGSVQGQCPTAIGETLSETDTVLPSDTISQCSVSVRSTPRASSTFNNRFGSASVEQFGGGLAGSNRSGSIESNTTWDSRLLDYTARSVSPTKRILYNADARTSTLDSKNKVIPNYFLRMGSNTLRNDKYSSSGTVNSTATTRLNLRPMCSMNTVANYNQDAEEFPDEHSRMSSTGTNILYKIRRQELAKGTNPSVRSMAQAFESFNEKMTRQKAISPGAQLRGFFSIRKSRSVDNEAKKQKDFERSITATINTPPTLIRGTANSTIALENSELSASYTAAAATPRGGRNPFKNMGAKIVERVRRSLSRSSRRDESVENNISQHNANVEANGEESSAQK